MSKSERADPYKDNILTQGLGPILAREEWLARITTLPPLPRELASMPPHVRMHRMLEVRDLHMPLIEGVRAAETIDLMLRQSYRYRDPARAATWTIVGNEPSAAASVRRAPAMAAVVVGHSGVGKTETIHRALGCYPGQVITHTTFPKLVGAHHQVVWLSADVPASGRLADLAANLMIAWDEAFAQYAPGHPRRFADVLVRERRDGARMLDEWRQVASAHFLGVLHLDEVQNFFRLPTLARRRARTGRGSDDAIELSLIEDQTLKSVLTLTNTWQIPLILSGTPDGVAALTKRLSTVQRFVTSGYHRIDEFRSADAPNFVMFLEQLGRYQFLRKRLPVTAELRELVIECTAGIPRLIIALWIAAQRIALERSDEVLRLDDFRRASATALAPVAPAVAALRSRDPRLMRRYEDLMPRDDAYWSAFWAEVQAP
ncbi:AAA family ATPase [Metallibacterium sp.]